jgi:hypothetical protein
VVSQAAGSGGDRLQRPSHASPEWGRVRVLSRLVAEWIEWWEDLVRNGSKDAMGDDD